MVNSPLHANSSANISKENANDSGELELSDSQGNKIVSNPGAKTPVWKLFGVPGNGNGAPRIKGKVVCRLCRKEMPYKNNTTTKKNIPSYILPYLRKVIMTRDSDEAVHHA